MKISPEYSEKLRDKVIAVCEALGDLEAFEMKLILEAVKNEVVAAETKESFDESEKFQKAVGFDLLGGGGLSVKQLIPMATTSTQTRTASPRAQDEWVSKIIKGEDGEVTVRSKKKSGKKKK